MSHNTNMSKNFVNALSCRYDNDLTESEIKQINEDIHFFALELCKITTNDALYNKNTMRKLKLIKDIVTIYKNQDAFEKLIRDINTNDQKEKNDALLMTFDEFLEKSMGKLSRNNFFENVMKIQRRNYMAFNEPEDDLLDDSDELDENP